MFTHIVLRRDGAWKLHNLNKELAEELVSIIAPVWRKLFSPRFFQGKAAKFLRAVDEKLDAVLETVPRPFAGDARELATMTRGMAGHVVKAAAENARELANSNQKRISEALVEGCEKN